MINKNPRVNFAGYREEHHVVPSDGDYWVGFGRVSAFYVANQAAGDFPRSRRRRYRLGTAARKRPRVEIELPRAAAVKIWSDEDGGREGLCRRTAKRWRDWQSY